MSDPGPLPGFALQVALLSLVAIGGLGPILPGLHRLTVEEGGWLSSEEFAVLYALAQAAPGPNMIFVALLGWRVAGLVGGIVAISAFSLPAFVLAATLEKARARWGGLSGVRLVECGLAPVTIGLVAASAWLVTTAAADAPADYLVVAVSAGVMLATRLHPLWPLSAAALAGGLGLV